MTAEEVSILAARLDEVDEDIGEVKAQLRTLPQLQADVQAIRDWVIEERQHSQKLRERCMSLVKHLIDTFGRLGDRVLDRALEPTWPFLALLLGAAVFTLLIVGTVTIGDLAPVFEWWTGTTVPAEVVPGLEESS